MYIWRYENQLQASGALALHNPADIVSPALTTAAKGLDPSAKMPMPIKMNNRKEPRIKDDQSSAVIMLREDSPTSSLRSKNSGCKYASQENWLAPYAGPKILEQNGYF
jgi:hypothetical protein